MPSAFSMPPMRCSRPGGAGDRPRPGQRLAGRAGTARTPARRRRRRGWARSRTSRVRSGSVVDVRAAATARSRWPGSRRRAGTPACGTSSRSAPPRCAASKQSDGERGATIGTGASPLRPNIACSRSACSVLVGSPVDGPPRCTSTMTSGSSSDTARPIVSRLQRDARPGRGGDAERAAERRARAPRRCRRSRPRPGRCATPKRLCLLSSCRMSEAGVIG